MEPQKILLYYCFTPLADPEAIRLWQYTLCDSLNLKGRILISEHGINGTVGGGMRSIKKYLRATKSYPAFRETDFKWSEGTSADFPRLSVKVRPEIVSFGAPNELTVQRDGVVGGGVRLTPQQVHELAETRDDLVFFDGRNAFEAAIGKFKGAIVPNVQTTRDFVREIDSGTYDDLKNKPIVTYCTGGVRCEVLSSLLLARGFEEVYQLDGGILRYGEIFGDDGLWEGSLYVFDARMHVEFSDHTTVIGCCERCNAPTSQYYNCANLACRKLILLCENCGHVVDASTCSTRHAGRR